MSVIHLHNRPVLRFSSNNPNPEKNPSLQNDTLETTASPSQSDPASTTTTTPKKPSWFPYRLGALLSILTAVTYSAWNAKFHDKRDLEYTKKVAELTQTEVEITRKKAELSQLRHKNAIQKEIITDREETIIGVNEKIALVTDDSYKIALGLWPKTLPYVREMVEIIAPRKRNSFYQTLSFELLGCVSGELDSMSKSGSSQRIILYTDAKNVMQFALRITLKGKQAFCTVLTPAQFPTEIQDKKPEEIKSSVVHVTSDDSGFLEVLSNPFHKTENMDACLQ